MIRRFSLYSSKSACVSLIWLALTIQSGAPAWSGQSKLLYHDLALQMAWRDSLEPIPAVVELKTPGTDVFQSLEVTVTHIYPGARMVDVEAGLAALENLAIHPGVLRISVDFEFEPNLKQGLALIGADLVRSEYDGSGVSVAIIDSGIDPTHPMLGGSDACDLENFPNQKVIGGWDTGERDSLPCDSSRHGTSVAGIAAGSVPDKSNGPSGDYVGGVAPGAKLYALKITKANGRPGSNAYLAALRWVVKHWNDDPAHPILIVNNSNTWNKPVNQSCQENPSSFGIKVIAVLEELNKLGITVFNSAGNAGSSQGIQWPGCMDRIQSVGAVWDTDDRVLKSSNSGELLDFFAPANKVITTAPGGKYAKFGTTSAAASYAAGAAAVIQQAAKQKRGHFLVPGQLLRLMRDSGTMLTDPKTKPPVVRPRINLAEAIRLLDQEF